VLSASDHPEGRYRTRGRVEFPGPEDPATGIRVDPDGPGTPSRPWWADEFDVAGQCELGAEAGKSCCSRFFRCPLDVLAGLRQGAGMPCGFCLQLWARRMSLGHAVAPIPGGPAAATPGGTRGDP